MFIVWAAKTIGAICAFLPEIFIRWFCWLVGSIFALMPVRRRYWMLSNLHHAFPEKPIRWHSKVLRESMRRLVEMALLSAASMYFSSKRIRKIIHVPEETRRFCLEVESKNSGGIVLVPHLTLLESVSFLPFVLQLSNPMAGLFRPFDNRRLNHLVKITRERWGGKMLSRRDGLRRAQEIIRKGGWVTIFFDQNTGSSGVLVPFLGRPVSATNLPGILATKFQTPVVMLYPKRTAFWRATLVVQVLECPCDIKSITLASAKALENYLKASDDQCADWLWAHNRWKTQIRPGQRLSLQQKKSFLDQSINKESSDATLQPQRGNRFWVRLPNAFDEIMLVLPLIRALRKSRPDAAITLLHSSDLLDLLKPFHLAETYIRLPQKRRDAFLFCWRLRKQFPDVLLLFKKSLRSDFEAWLTRSPQRFGMTFSKRKRFWLTHTWQASLKDILESNHKVLLWEKCWRYFGLAAPVENTLLDCKPAKIIADEKAVILLKLTPDKAFDWPIQSWHTLLNKLIDHDKGIHFCCLEVTPNTVSLNNLTESIPSESVSDLSVGTPLNKWAFALKNSRLVLCCDSAALYLANAAGAPGVALFHYRHVKNKALFFEAPMRHFFQPTMIENLQQPIKRISPEVVFDAIKPHL